MKNSNKKITPAKIKAALALRGLSASQWARQKGYCRGTVHDAIHDRRPLGKQTQKVRKELVSYV